MKTTTSLLAITVAMELALAGCVFPAAGGTWSTSMNGNQVSATVTKWSLLHLSGPAELTSIATGKLKDRCPSGNVSNVTTQPPESRDYFVVQHYTVSATGTCS